MSKQTLVCQCMDLLHSICPRALLLPGFWLAERSEGIHICGRCRVVAPPYPSTMVFQPGVAPSFPLLFAHLLFPPPTVRVLRPNWETVDVSPCLRHSSLQHATQSPRYAWRSTHQARSSRLHLTPLTPSPNQPPGVGVAGTQRLRICQILTCNRLNELLHLAFPK